MALGVVAQDLRHVARRGRSDGFVLIPSVGRDPRGDPRPFGNDPDPPMPNVLGVVMREVAPDPLPEPILAEGPSQHRFGIERPSRRFPDDRQVRGRRRAHLHGR